MKSLTTVFFAALSKVAELFAPPIPQAYHEVWQPTRRLMELPPMEIQTTGGIRMPLTSDGKRWPGPAGSLMAVSRGASYHRHRDTGVLVPPMLRLHPSRLTPIPETPGERQMATCPPFDFDPLKTVMAERQVQPVREVLDLGFANLATWETPEARQRAAIARFDEARANSGALSWLYADPPVLAPIPEQALSVADRTAVSKTTDKPTSAMVELARLASQDTCDETAEVPSYMRQRARELQQQLRESE